MQKVRKKNRRNKITIISKNLYKLLVFVFDLIKKALIGIFIVIKNVWLFFVKHQIISSIVLTAIVSFIILWMIKHLWVDLFNCNYLITDKLGAPKEITEGIHIDLEIYKKDIAGLGSLLNPVLEVIRQLSIVTILIFIAVLSFIVNYVFTKFNFVIKLVTFNREQWKRFFLGYRVFIATFIILSLLFLFLALQLL